MDQKLTQELVSLHPLLYSMCRGFECDNGWYSLLLKLSQQLEGLIKRLPTKRREGVGALQVKEKFGTLRFYMGASTPAMERFINKAEAKSAIICEICGNPGKLHDKGGWVKTLCGKDALQLEFHLIKQKKIHTTKGI